MVARAMARAFFDDPLQVWALRDPATRLSILEQVFELLSRYSSVPRGESYTDATLACAAFWVPPGPFELDRAAAEAMAPMLDLLGDANERFRAAEDTMRAHRPEEPHFYLQGLGTDPPRQGEGLATAGDATGAHALRRRRDSRLPGEHEGSATSASTSGTASR